MKKNFFNINIILIYRSLIALPVAIVEYLLILVRKELVGLGNAANTAFIVAG